MHDNGTYGTVPTVRYLRYLLKSFLTHLICAVSFRFLKLKNPEHEVPLRDVRVHIGTRYMLETYWNDTHTNVACPGIMVGLV